MKNKTALNIILVISIIALSFAYFVEYILNYKPCNLCLIERLPYFLAIIIIFLGISLNRFEKIIFISLGLIFTSATILSLYHVGIEQGFFKESSVCTTKDLSQSLTKEEILEQLNKNIISCKDVSFAIFGLSLATINTIFSICLSVIFGRLFLNYGKN